MKQIRGLRINTIVRSDGRLCIQPNVNTMFIVVLSDGVEFSHQVLGIEDKQSIKKFSTDRSTTWLLINRSMKG